MADMENEEDLFADLYDGEADEPITTTTSTKAEPEPAPVKAELETDSALPDAAPKAEPNGDDFNIKTEFDGGNQQYGGAMQGVDHTGQNGGYGNGGNGRHYSEDRDRPIHIKDDGKMFIGGLNWETTDESLKQYFSQFGDVVECTVMRDGATGRSRGFGFLTFRDPKVVNTVMVKEHTLDGKLIDPKRAIPRDEQERTAKIFVGGVSQDASQDDFANFFRNFGNVLDATLMMDKETGRPRGFGFVTFDSEAAVDRTLEGPLAICNKAIEVKRAQPRGDMREQDSGPRKFGRHGKNDNFNNGGQQFGGNQQQPQMGGGDGQNGGGNNMSPAMMAAYWQRMQQYFSMMQQQMAMTQNPHAQMMQNPQMMQQMMAQRGMQGMNPQMMQQMAAMQGYPGMSQEQQGSQSPVGGGGGGGTPGGTRGGFNAQEQLMFEQRKYEQQSMQRVQPGQQFGPGGGGQGNTWEGMYDDVPAPAGMQGGGNRGGGFGGNRGRGGRGSQGPSAPQAPANAPTGPKNAGRPGGNYRGGGRGGHRGFHPYARGGPGV
ncbi:hypothetical protein B0A55_00301 [Friedmanniomyces simplex]|uniref:RRM domain-containing protein n=1 Tax=Friedmanniomyces simplex TaxID=329884 RepID=A0A4U0Y3I3_9PEZI|nr:hypothetical protein B0A55_00301 [Friedmanniomyces simplex]